MAKKKETEKKLTEREKKKLELDYKSSLDILLTFPIMGNEDIIENISKLLNGIEESCPEILQECVNKVKSAVQKEAQDKWYDSGCWGLEAMATGVGKSKVAINICEDGYKKFSSYLKVLLIVPTEKLRDENWRDEFAKWKLERIYDQCLTRVCYASLDNIENEEFDLVIGDEFHNITEDKSVFFKRNKIKRLICLTATPPTDKIKVQILKSLAIKTDYHVPLDIATKLKLVAPYDVTVVECRLDDVIKNVPSGTKTNPFMTTEKKAYDYKTNLVNTTMYSRNIPAASRGKIHKFRVLDRMRFIKDLESRTKNAKFILENFIKPEERTLIFCGSIAQANELCQYSFHSKTNDKHFEQFKAKIINRMSCVSAVNEGHNIPDVETIFVVCIESGEKTITQQIGRGIRFAIGHKCRVIIIIITDTVDEQWFKKATINLDQSKFRYVRMANLLNGVDTI